MEPNKCAVVDCPNPAHLQVCVFDGRYHHHGLTHYSHFEKQTGLTFRPIEEGWFGMCNDHQAIITEKMHDHIERMRTRG